jgi:hypothetical protein
LNLRIPSEGPLDEEKKEWTAPPCKGLAQEEPDPLLKPFVSSKRRDQKQIEKMTTKARRALRSSLGAAKEIDEQFFASYGDIAIHQEMLQDEVRMSAY